MAKLELALLVGEESKRWLSEAQATVERMEAAAKQLAMVGQNTTSGSDEARDEPIGNVSKKSKRTTKAASFDEDETETNSDDSPSFGEDEEESDEFEVSSLKSKKSAKAKTYKQEDVNKACKDHAKRTSYKETVKLLKSKFKVESISELKPSQYGEVIALMEGNGHDEDDNEN